MLDTHEIIPKTEIIYVLLSLVILRIFALGLFSLTKSVKKQVLLECISATMALIVLIYLTQSPLESPLATLKIIALFYFLFFEELFDNIWVIYQFGQGGYRKKAYMI